MLAMGSNHLAVLGLDTYILPYIHKVAEGCHVLPLLWLAPTKLRVYSPVDYDRYFL